MDYYAYGNTDIIKQMFQTIAMMTGANSSYGSLFQLVVLFAFIVALGYATFKQTFGPIATTVLGAMLVWYGLMLPKVTVNIVDQTNPTKVMAVSDIPLGIAFMGNISSSLGKWYVDKSEIIYTQINDINYGRSGLVFGANAYNELRRANLINYLPELQTDLSQFMTNCTDNDVFLYKLITVQEFQNSDDIWATMGKTNEVLPTRVWNPATQSRETKYCNEAYAIMTSSMNSMMGSTQLLKDFTVMLDPAGGAYTAADGARVMSALESSYSNMFNSSSKTALKIIQQEMLVNALKIGEIQNAQIAQSPEQTMVAIASAQAEAQVNTQNKTAWAMAAKYIPIAHNVIEAIIISLFPLVAVMAVLGGMSMFSTVINYLGTLMWIKLWPGLFALVNGVANMYQANHAVASSHGASGTTLANSMDMLSVSNSTADFAGGLCMLVPVIAAGIIKLGSSGLQSAFATVSQPGGRATESSAASVGSGNLSMGNGSWNNANANKDDRSVVFSDPGTSRTMSSWTTTTQDTMGNRGTVQNAYSPIQAQRGLTQAYAKQQAAEQQISESQQLSASAANNLQAGAALTLDKWNRASDQVQKTVASQNNMTQGEVRQMLESSGKSQSNSVAATKETHSGVEGSLKGGIGLGAIINAGATTTVSGGGSISASNTKANMEQSAQTTSKIQSINNALSKTSGESNSQTTGTGSGTTATQYLQNASTLSMQAQQMYQSGVSARNSATEEIRASLSVNSSVPLNSSDMTAISSANGGGDLSSAKAASAAQQSIIGQTGAGVASSVATQNQDTRTGLDAAKDNPREFYNQHQGDLNGPGSKFGDDTFRAEGGGNGGPPSPKPLRKLTSRKR